MAFPIINIQEPQPFVMKQGEEKDIHFTIQTNTVGNSRLTLSLTAASCTFANGTKIMEKNVETSTANELSEVIIRVAISSSLSKVLMISMKAEILNVDQETDEAALRIRLDATQVAPLNV